MRDINRLYMFYYKLGENHKKLPDWRFGQFMLNFMSWYYNKYHTDVFYVEDDKMILLIEEFIDETMKIEIKNKTIEINPCGYPHCKSTDCENCLLNKISITNLKDETNQY